MIKLKNKKVDEKFLKNKKVNEKFLKNKKVNEKFLKNKKAQGHVEMILSFLIFVGFLLFMFIFMNPFAQTKPGKIIDSIQKPILDNIQDGVGRLSVIVEEGKCYEQGKLSSYKETGETNIRVIQDINNNRKYDVYYGKFLINDNPPPACTLPADFVYTIGTYSKEKMIVYEKIQELRTNYMNDYDELKGSLGITNDFIFELKRINNEIEIGVDKEIPIGIEVEAINLPIRVINNQGIILEYILNIRVW